MIYIGLTSFQEHDTLTGKRNNTLYEYAGYLPLVELDTAFYGIPKKQTVEKWVNDVPDSFRFVIKVYQGISKQGKWQTYYQSVEEMIAVFLEAMEPIIKSRKLHCFLIQFPAFFKCTKENVNYIRELRGAFQDLPISIEFRDASWYSKAYKERTIAFMEKAKISLAIVDEPQVIQASVPYEPVVTNSAFTLFRLHGRNTGGWQANDEKWREKRTLYRYSDDELIELSKDINKIAKVSKEIAIIFNNNSGGDAADNALRLKEFLAIDFQGLNPAQIDLF